MTPIKLPSPALPFPQHLWSTPQAPLTPLPVPRQDVLLQCHSQCLTTFSVRPRGGVPTTSPGYATHFFHYPCFQKVISNMQPAGYIH